MTARIAAITGLFVSAVFAAGCQNSAPHLGQSTLGAGLFGPHVSAAQQPQSRDPWLNSELPQGAANSGHVRVAGMQQPPQGQATSNASPTIIQAGYQQPSQPAGYQPMPGPFAPATTVPVGNSGWQSSQPPVTTRSY